MLCAAACALVLPSPPRALRPPPPARARAARLELSSEPSASFAVPSDFFDASDGWLEGKREYDEMYKRSVEDPSGFWGEIAEEFHWDQPWTHVVDSNFAPSKGEVFTKWFVDGKTNVCYNALDRHVADGHGDQMALIHEPNDEGESVKSYTYAEVLDEVQRLANVLKAKGVRKGDRVSIFMPMVPQLPIAMLACARIGAVHSVVFGGFSAEVRLVSGAFPGEMFV